MLTRHQKNIVRDMVIALGKKEDEAYDFIDERKFKGDVKFDDDGYVTRFDLNSSKLTGSIPKEIGLRYRLTYLNLSRNNLTGSIPEIICELVKLTYLDLSENNLTGVIPDSIGKLVKLICFDVSRNKLTGPIPASIGELALLSRLDLLFNDFTGPLDVSNLSELKFFGFINENCMQTLREILVVLGTKEYDIYDFIGRKIKAERIMLNKVGDVTYLDLSDSKLTGTIPESIGKLAHLTDLILSHNNLTGAIPESVGQLAHLTRLDLLFNDFTGALDVSNLSKLKFFGFINESCKQTLEETSVNLGIPTHQTDDFIGSGSLKFNGNGDVTSLTMTAKELKLKSAPARFISESIYQLVHLTRIDLRSKALTGAIHDDIGQLVNLTYLDLSKNKLTGAIPSSIGKLVNLIHLDLSGNVANDSSERHSDVRLTGFIPESVGQLANLIYFDLSGNNLTGAIPESIGQLAKLKNFNVRENELNGTIPESVCQLTSLVEVDFSDNYLTGIIPENFGNIKTLTVASFTNNESMSGHFPVMENCIILASGTNVSQVAVRLKNLRQDYCYLEYWVIVVYVSLSYIDLITDLLTIQELFKEGRVGIASANIFFVALGGALGVLESDKSLKSIFLNITYANVLIDGITTLRTGKQTTGLVVGKKLDAIVRSMPSIVLQLYTLLGSLEEYKSRGFAYTLLITSVGFGILGSAVTLAGLHSKSGDRLFSKQFLVIIAYYLAELLLRSLVIALAFLTVQEYAFIVAGIDFALRCLASAILNEFKELDLSVACFYTGSDSAVPGEFGLIVWLCGSVGNFLEMMIFMIVMFTLPSEAMHDVRDQGTAIHIAIVMVVSFVVKTVLFMYINGNYIKEAGIVEYDDSRFLNVGVNVKTDAEWREYAASTYSFGNWEDESDYLYGGLRDNYLRFGTTLYPEVWFWLPYGILYKGMTPPKKEDPNTNSSTSTSVAINILQHMT